MSLISGGQTTSVYLLPGMSVRISTNYFFPHSGPVDHQFVNGGTESVALMNGYVVDDTSVGEIKGDGTTGVVYKHKAFEYNVITFYALTGERGRVSIMSVPVHDHSSILSGGPAYGTYFSDDTTVSNET